VKVLDSRELVLELQADVEIAASEAAVDFALAASMSSEKADEIRMAVLEACINAAEHSDTPDCCIRLGLRVLGEDRPQLVEVRVGDHGVGIPAEILEKKAWEQPRAAPRKRGWGLSIIRGLMDKVEIDSRGSGTTVIMAKWI
jgi:anti-sigma regulatory factor (Ser/Thr protein kinase)